MDPVGSEVGNARRILSDQVPQPLELRAPDVREVAAFGAGGGGFVQEDRQGELGADPRADRPGEQDRVGHRRPLDRHEGQHVDGAHARVGPLVDGQVDQVDSLLRDREGGFFDGSGRAGEREDAAVVVAVRGEVEDRDAAGPGLGGERLDDLGAPALAEIRHAFDDHVAILRKTAGEGDGYSFAGRGEPDQP